MHPLPPRGSDPPHIALNAQLLKLGETYRSAGITNYIFQLLQALARENQFEYTLWTGQQRPEFPSMRQRLTRLPVHLPVARIFWEQCVQPFEIQRVRPDLVHGMAFVLPLLSQVPGIITIFDLSFFRVPDAFNPLNRVYLQTMSRISAQRAAHICAIAEHGKAEIVAQFGIAPEKVTVVYPGKDERFTAPPPWAAIEAFRSERGLPPRFILYMGTLEPRKNIPLLVRGFARLCHRLPGLKLVIAGGKGWGYGEIFAEVSRLGLSDAVLFPGFVPAHEQALWYGAAELFVYPSRYEGFGMPPLEAMACGTPVITSKAPSLLEVVGGAGSTVDAADESGLASEMEALLNDPVLRAERREAGLQQASRFGWRKSARVQGKVYSKALGLTE